MIKNIIFDLGGILLNLDYFLTSKAFQQFNPTFGSVDAIYDKQVNQKLFEDFETGKISSEKFYDGIRSIVEVDISNNQIIQAWNAMLLDFPTERMTLLSKLRDKFRLFLLSNTNEIHLEEYTRILQHTFGVSNLQHIFEKEYFSHRIGLRKPNAAIFQFVLSENSLSASETLFIDDSPQHIEGAKKVGMQTALLKKGTTILNLFETFNLES